jgi:ferrous iron transport protein B
MTVDLLQAEVDLGGVSTEIVDLPGIYDLRGFSHDEAIVRNFLEQNSLNLAIILLNAAQIDRQISLALEVRQLGLPSILLLNMADEAAQFGVEINCQLLAERLGMPVLAISAKYRQGYPQAIAAIQERLTHQARVGPIQGLEGLLLAEAPLAAAIDATLQGAVKMPLRLSDRTTHRLDRWLLHPWLGLPLFFSVMYLVFQAIYTLGSPLQMVLANALGALRSILLEPLLAGAPALLKGVLLDGLYEGIGTVVAFLPVLFLFFLCMSMVEDSGYLSRAAYLMDALMERLGLDGRAFVMVLMGFGCNVPAILGTRVMRSPGLRLLSMLIIPFSLCSARLNVFVFMATTMFSPSLAPRVIFSLYLMSFAAAILTALLFKHRFPNQEPLLLEMPPYRFPTLSQMLNRAWCEVKHFWFWSRRYIILGVVAIWLLNHLPPQVPAASPQTLAGLMGQALQPLLSPLGISPHLTIALLFGFIAKEIVLGGLAVIYGLPDQGSLSRAIAQSIDWVQAYSFMLFTLLYTPCLSTLAVLKTESKSWKFAGLSLGWSLFLAWGVSLLFYQSARTLGL